MTSLNKLTIAVMMIVLVAAGCDDVQWERDRNLARAARQQCASHGGYWAGYGNQDFDGPCFAVDSIIPVGQEPTP